MTKLNIPNQHASVSSDFEINSIAISPDQERMALGGINAPAIYIKSITNNESIAQLKLETTAIVANGIKWSSQGHIASIHKIGSTSVRVWDGLTYAHVMDIDCKDYRGCRAVEFSPAGEYLAIACKSNPRKQPTIIITDMRDGTSKAVSVQMYTMSVAWLGNILVVVGHLLSPVEAIGLVFIDPHNGEILGRPWVLSESKDSDISIATCKSTSDVVVSAVHYEGYPRYTSIYRVRAPAPIAHQQLVSNFTIEGKARLLGFLDDVNVALDVYDETTAPIKIFSMTDNTSQSVNLGTKYTSDCAAIVGNTLAIGTGQKAQLFKFGHP